MAQVVPHTAEIEAQNTRIVAVSFGTEYWARAGQKTTGAQFPIWLDPHTQTYDAYGMTRSRWASWGPKNLWYYARAWARGDEIHEGTGEDTNQLGGDFVVDNKGIIRFAYPSKDPTDRPSVSALLDAIGAINDSG